MRIEIRPLHPVFVGEVSGVDLRQSLAATFGTDPEFQRSVANNKRRVGGALIRKRNHHMIKRKVVVGHDYSS